MSLRTEVLGLLDNAQQLCAGCADAQMLVQTLKQMRARLDQPLRVAVVGIMKAGKSTFMNALMGKNILFTGDLETTYTVCWFRYAPTPSLRVHFRDGSSLDTAFEDLEKWSVRKYEKENPRINDVRYLIIHYPAEVLKTLEFIDTPGLNSIYGIDAQNTEDFLALKSSEDTLHETSMADAVVYAFSHTASGFDHDILHAFHNGGSTASPINSIGILTKVDATGIWNVFDDTTPVQAATAVSNNVMSNASMKQLLFTVLPVCAKVCEGYCQMSEQDWQTMELISKSEHEDLQDLLYDARQFCVATDACYDRMGSPEDRARLMALVGQYGILEIARLLRQGKSRDEIGAQLQSLCGIDSIRDILYRHFANRTFVIKTQYIFSNLLSQIHRLKQDEASSAKLLDIAEQIGDGIDALMSSVQTLKELKVLQMYYNGQLQFQNEEEKMDFLRVTGEFGHAAELRLGAPFGTTVEELAAIAQEKVHLWHAKAAGGWILSGSYVEAATTIARSYEQMYYHLNALNEE